MRVIEPMLAMPSSGASNRQPILLTDLTRGDHLAQEKLDGLRAVLYSDSRGVRLINRSGTDITAVFPEFKRLRLGDVVLDGEIVADDGLFSTVATRGKQGRRFEIAARAHPCHFVAFDLLHQDGVDLLDRPLEERLVQMRKAVGRRALVKPVRQSDDILGLWARVVAEGGEGLIVKHRRSKYLPGRRATSWIKFKAVQRITAIAIGYERGERRHFGAIYLALLDDAGKPMSIGKVGTGWTGKQERGLRERLDKGEMFPVEIEALNRTKDNLLRFPVFRGERTDLGLEAANVSQLEALPVY